MNHNYVRDWKYDTFNCKNCISPKTYGSSWLQPKKLIWPGKFPNQVRLGIYPNQLYEEFTFKNNKKIITSHILGSELIKLIEKQARGNQSVYLRQTNDLEKESQLSYSEDNNKSAINTDFNISFSDEDGTKWD
ncbi:hypothetical protein [Spiroplasma sp. SV19]|uniref:hypothetical protein n=1 Tax=Spiroplasma sp. SV19 TaxID=2570468 RepID=UPI0024B6EAC9|nr:hypothetical protein [Spiroplasma sp. SV19]WHQ37175.1 hypothetical protein E7Y35_04705 [Spiroplasma sp. SV19]